MRPPGAELAAGATGAAVGASSAAAAGMSPAAGAAAATLGAALGLFRVRPTLAWIVAAAALLATAAATPVELPFGVLALGAAHAYVAGRRAGRWSGAAGLAALVAATVPGGLADTSAPVALVLLVVTPWAVGRALREQDRLAVRLAERSRELEAEREAHARLSVRYERARIASELHDIVAHAISVMVVQAGAGQRLAAVDPMLTAEVFGAIADAAREAEADLARLVALLADEEAIGPVPDLALLEELVARAASTGLDVGLRLEGARDGLPADVVRTAYRVVQESLTNALRYGTGSRVVVLVRGDPDALVLEVVNGPAARNTELAGQGTGHGLRGLQARLSDCGGRLDAGPTPEGGWRVSARMPRRAPLPV